MNALSRAKSFWIIIVDQSGPIGNTKCCPGDWSHHAPEVLDQLCRAAYPGLTVLSAKWAEQPRDYTISDPVLLVEIPGTHAVYTPKARVKSPRKAPLDVDVAGPDDSYRHQHGYGALKSAIALKGPRVFSQPAPALDAVIVVNTCTTCGTAYTAATWAALPLLGVKEFREGNTMVREDYRTCTCGSTRMIFTTRIAPETTP